MIGFLGPQESPYEHGVFHVDLRFLHDYPVSYLYLRINISTNSLTIDQQIHQQQIDQQIHQQNDQQRHQQRDQQVYQQIDQQIHQQ